VEALLQIHLCYFSHILKLRDLLLSSVTVSLHYLTRCLCWVQQKHVASVASGVSVFNIRLFAYSTSVARFQKAWKPNL